MVVSWTLMEEYSTIFRVTKGFQVCSVVLSFPLGLKEDNLEALIVIAENNSGPWTQLRQNW